MSMQETQECGVWGLNEKFLSLVKFFYDLKRIFFVIIPSQQQCTDCRDTCSLVYG